MSVFQLWHLFRMSFCSGPLQENQYAPAPGLRRFDGSVRKKPLAACLVVGGASQKRPYAVVKVRSTLSAQDKAEKLLTFSFQTTQISIRISGKKIP